jgi:hypothetical protein
MVIFIFFQAACTNYVEPRMTFIKNNLHVDIQQSVLVIECELLNKERDSLISTVLKKRLAIK